MDSSARRVYAERARRRLPSRLRRRRIAVRIAGLVGTAALAGVAVAITLMVMPDRHAGAPARTAAPAPTPAAKHKKAARRVPRRHGPSRALLRERRAAVARLRREGYKPLALAEYDFKATLRVLIGRRPVDSANWAFFFVRGRYIGHDALTPSARVRLVRASKHAVTLAYTTYGPDDAACCPRGPRAIVRFRLDGSRLTPEQPIPLASARLHTG